MPETYNEVFDPNSAATLDSGVFGLPYQYKEASLVYLSVPWEPTTSFRGGTSGAPEAILAASRQVDLYDCDVMRPYEAGLYAHEVSEEVLNWSKKAKALARPAQGAVGEGTGERVDEINALCERLNRWVYDQTLTLLNDGKIPGIIGGDHSVPFGAIKAACKKIGRFGILHFDAHSDTREAYEGFTWSHASIMYNVLTLLPEVEKLTQVGIRDYCEQELDFCKKRPQQVSIFFDRDMKTARYEGRTFKDICREIVSTLPQQVWISFDIDGLDPKYCPDTGTPVPGGLEFDEAVFLMEVLVKSGRKIIGFDLNEVGQSQWDAIVGARMLYKLTGFTLASQGKARLCRP